LAQHPQNIEPALRLARSISDDFERSAALLTIFSPLLKTDQERAQALLPEIQDSHHTQAVAALVEAMVPLDPQKALTEARRLNAPENLLGALQNMGRHLVMSKKYNIEQVLSLAQTLSNPSEQDRFLAGAATVYRRPEGMEVLAGGMGLRPLSTPPVQKATVTYPALAFQTIARIQSKAIQARLYTETIQGLMPIDGNKILPQILAMQEEPLASQLRREIVTVFTNPNLPQNLLQREKEAEMALAIAEAIKATPDRSLALNQIALFWRKKNPKKANDIAQTIPLAEIREKTLQTLTDAKPPGRAG
jgi:hypothetical protein